MTASTIATAVSTLSISLFGLLAPTLTTCPVTAMGPVLARLTGPGPRSARRPSWLTATPEAPGDGEPSPRQASWPCR